MNSEASQKPTRRWVRHLSQGVAVVVILGAAAGLTWLMISQRETPAQRPATQVGPLVNVVEARRTSVPVVVESFGTVEPRVRIDLVPQVGGKVVEVHPDLVDGGRFDAGELLLRIDPSDYALAVDRAKAAVRQARSAIDAAEAEIAGAEAELAQQQAEADVARAEWRQQHGDRPPPPLLVRQPQIASIRSQLQAARARRASAEAEIASAQARLREAELNLERTRIDAPFPGRVMSESVDEGQYVTPGQPLAEVYSTDVAQIVVPIENAQLQWFDVPMASARRQAADSPGAEPNPTPATIRTDFAGAPRQWSGRVVRTAGSIDPRSRMVRVVVEVIDPFDAGHGVPLVPGMFVDVEIEGRPLSGVRPVPRHAIRTDRTVWVVEEGKLRIRPVTIARFDREHAYVSDGLGEGDRVITSSLDVVTDGMQVRIPNEPRRAGGSAPPTAEVAGPAAESPGLNADAAAN